jgi:hypothetical protein
MTPPCRSFTVACNLANQDYEYTLACKTFFRMTAASASLFSEARTLVAQKLAAAFNQYRRKDRAPISSAKDATLRHNP